MKSLHLLVVIVTLLMGCSQNSVQQKREVLLQGNTMGTTYNIKIIVDDNAIDLQSLQSDIDNKLLAINNVMSTYIPTSELSLFNKHITSEPIIISDCLRYVLQEALRLGKISEGKLDITIGPLINLWGFGAEFKPNKIPSEIVLEKTINKTGIQHIALTGNKLSKTIPELYIDLSTIAKGYGVDVIAELLQSSGIDNYLVEIGGEMRLSGFKHTGELWHVAIEKPVTNERVMQQVIVPKNNAVATSGDYRNYFEIKGKRFSHIIDPLTGKPVNHKLVSVTVIHPLSMTADGLSTAMMVMGEDKALAFAEKHDIAAYLITRSGDGFIEQSTVKFEQFLK